MTGLEEIVEAIAVRIWADFAGNGRREFCVYCESRHQVHVLREALSHCSLGKNQWGPGEDLLISFLSGFCVRFLHHGHVLQYAPGSVVVEDIRKELGLLAREGEVPTA
jgi:hypothetical protein